MGSPPRIKSISYHGTQATLALLRIIALGNHDIAAGRTIPSAEVFRRLRARRRKR
jgi:hypothetical protein